MRRFSSSGCGSLLEFDEVSRRLRLGTRTDIGTHEIEIRQVIGSVGRVHEFDGCFRPRSRRLRALLHQIRAARPDAADVPILVYQVDHAYFVVDGHKRLALALEEGREFIDAEVSRFASRFHVGRGTTRDEIRATELERRFREITGLDEAVPEATFPLGDPDAYLELAESVKAHGYDLSRQHGRVFEPAEVARHWYDRVYRPAVDLAHESGVTRVLTSCSEAELFLVLRRGAEESMGPQWEMPATFAARAAANLRAADRRGVPAAIAGVARRQRRKPGVLPASDVAPEVDNGSQRPSETTGRTGDVTGVPGTIVSRPRRQRDLPTG